MNKLLSNQREEGFSGKKNKRRNIYLLELSFLFQRTEVNQRKGGVSFKYMQYALFFKEDMSYFQLSVAALKRDKSTHSDTNSPRFPRHA